MKGENLTDKFLNAILAITKEEINSEDITKAKYSLLDYIGVTVGGSKISSQRIDKLRLYFEDNTSDCPSIGYGKKVSLQNAILFNGISSHILELDDGSRYGVTHPGGPLLSALLPVAYKHNVDWHDFLMGIFVGYETILRISTSIQPSHYNRGYHPTASCTPLGISVGICVMLRLPYEILKDAFSYACISAGGSLKAIADTSRIKVLNAARAAELGFTSYCVAGAGFTGPDDVLTGNTGFLKMMSSEFKEEILIRKENESLWIHRVYCKLYASCRHTHGAIEGILKLKEECHLDSDDIEKIELRIYKGIKGKHDIFEIYGEESAKMSIPYCAAAAFVFGNANDEVFKSDHINNPEVKRLMEVITIIEDDYISSLLPTKRATETNIYLKDNKKYSKFIGYPVGEPENPVKFEEIKQKFMHLVTRSDQSEKYAEELISIIFSDVPDMTKLNKILYKL